MATQIEGTPPPTLSPRYEGRLELTWTNKPLRLLAHDDGQYEWVAPSDYRVAEVHLLRDRDSVGTASGTGGRAKDSLLVQGDALNALTSLVSLPEFAHEYVGQVRLCYIDPPFNTRQSFLQYDDTLEHSVWLTILRDRMALIRDLLAEDGSLWVHLDDSEMPYCKVLLDELFGRSDFVAQITIELNPKGRQLDRFFATSHDYLLIYGKSIRHVRLHTANIGRPGSRLDSGAPTCGRERV